jgi:hypothetical protein
MFLLFSFSESMKNAELYLPSFQSSAGDSQASAADLVQPPLHLPWGCASPCNFGGIPSPYGAERFDDVLIAFVKINGKTALDVAFARFLIM